MNKKSVLIMGAVIFALIAAIELPHMGTANYRPLVAKMNVSELSATATEIVEATVKKDLGTIREVDSVDGEDMVYTRYLLAVKSVLKGSPAKEITVRVAGGSYLTTQIVAEDQPVFSENQQTITFLSKPSNWNGDYRVLGGFQGNFAVTGSEAVQNETGEKFVTTELINQIKSSAQSTKKIVQ
ncbi:hypothetical protein HY844_00765 [Candidatus Berkelbacteria bacterium]|nr:hypothetical protein [Candidatus Berkelbacteria bacterium]